MIHALKCLPLYFEDVASGAKTFEVRRNDRDFQPFDLLVLREVDERCELTGREVRRRVTYVLPGGQFGIADGYVVMALAEPNGEPVAAGSAEPPAKPAIDFEHDPEVAMCDKCGATEHETNATGWYRGSPHPSDGIIDVLCADCAPDSDECPDCGGTGYTVSPGGYAHGDAPDSPCAVCEGRGRLAAEPPAKPEEETRDAD